MPQHTIAFWNLENLFAPANHPDREPWLDKTMKRDLKGWTKKLFARKIEQLAIVIQQMNAGRGPEILGVCEVENEFVLDELNAHLNSLLPERDYRAAHADSSVDQRGIDTAFIYDANSFTVDPDHIYSHFVMRRTGTRDITQVTFESQSGHRLVGLCNHWPSRSGGAHESRGFRMTAGETLAYWHQRIWQELGKDTPVIALGDFNDDPFDESITVHARATRERGDAERANTAARFYNLAWRYLQQEGRDRKGKKRLLEGTLYHDGNGYVFDQLMVSRGLLKSGPLQVLEETAQMELDPRMVDHRLSRGPIRYGLSKGNAGENVDQAGFSDHFPVSVVIKES